MDSLLPSGYNFSDKHSFHIHQNLGLLLWTIVPDLLILLARYNKTTKHYHSLHGFLFTLVGLGTFFMSSHKVTPHHYTKLLNQKEADSSAYHRVKNAHKIFGPFLQYFIIGMFAAGIVLR